MSGPVGFGGRAFTASGNVVRVKPLERETKGGTSISLGFTFCVLADEMSGADGADLAEYLSCPKRAAAPELYEALAETCRLSDEMRDEYGWTRVPKAQAMIDRIQALLAKARGEA